MAGPCWTTPSPRTRLPPEAVAIATQPDLFQWLRPKAVPAPGSAGPPEPRPADPPGEDRPRVPEKHNSLAPPAGALAADELVLEGGPLVVWYVARPQARQFRLTLQSDGSARCAIPRRGSLAEARRFVSGCRRWLNQQLLRRAAQPQVEREWQPGSLVWFRGRQTPLEVRVPTPTSDRSTGTMLTLAEFRFQALSPKEVKAASTTVQLPRDLRPVTEAALRELARRELPQRVRALATQYGFQVVRVTVRNQRTRWGSCSRHGAISLNWRLVQVPDWVCDYIILHELAHLRQLNHSERFWDEVARLCPKWEEAEAWIKRHGRELH